MIFTEKQIEFMRSIGLEYDFENLQTLSNDVYDDIYNKVVDRYEYSGLDLNYEPTKTGKICEEIIDILSDME